MSQTHETVKAAYSRVAQESTSCCAPSCCGPSNEPTAQDLAELMGYSTEQLLTLPPGANLGLGCGNPQAIADLKPGETVVDLGSGAGIDCFLAAKAVGAQGKVIGVDMTPAMLAKARENAAEAHIDNVEFREGTIEAMPIEDGAVDVIISNCVVNLSPDKPAVFREAFRVLKPGGRLAISDVVARQEIPQHMKDDPELLAGRIGGCETVDFLRAELAKAGFEDISIVAKGEHDQLIKGWVPGQNIGDYVVSAAIEAVRP